MRQGRAHPSAAVGRANFKRFLRHAPYFAGAPAARVVHDLAIKGAEAIEREQQERADAVERLLTFSAERRDLVDWDVLERIDELAWGE